MKKLLNIVSLLLITNATFAQAPQGIPYQAIARNSSGTVLASQPISVRFTIHDATATGTVVYQETFAPTTNSSGLFNVNVGMGTVVSGTFSGINWGVNAKFMQVEMDPAGGTSYVNMGTTQMMSVPYALYSGSASPTHQPSVTTGGVSGTSYTAVTIGGDVTSNSGELLIFRGVCIDTASLPGINTAIIATGNDTGAYTVNATALMPGAVYHARAFATNSNGTAFGDTVSFTTIALSSPTVTTDTMSNVTNISASGGGAVTADGGSPVTARGLCYSTSPGPTIASSLSPSGTGTGAFATTLSGLTSSVTYYVRAYATNAAGTSYGAQQTFTTVLLSVPTVTTDTVTSVSYTAATSGINCSNNGGSTITAQGICWNTAPAPTTSNYTVPTGTGVANFVANMAGLIPNMAYYVRAYSTNSTGTAYGVQFTFTTLAQTAPGLTTNPVVGVSTTTANSGGNISSDGGSTITLRGVCWSTTTVPTKDSSNTTDGTGTGIYNSSITGLAPGTTYYVRAYATNSIGTSYGSLISFTTSTTISSVPGLPTVGTDLINYVAGAANAVSGGYVNTDGASPVTARGICWNTSTAPTLANSFTLDGTGLGYFTDSITGMSGCGTTYYVRAYATNSTGTAYGNQYTVSHVSIPLITTNSATSVTATSATIGGTITSDGGCPVTSRGVCWGISANPDTTGTHVISGSGTGSFSTSLTGLLSNFTYHFRSYSVNSQGITFGSDVTFTTGTPVGLYIGESYAGGIIFYIDGTGSHGLVCAPTDQGTSSFGCSGTSIAGLDTVIGSGAQNTAYIVAGCTTTGIAAYICSNLSLSGYTDWYLPSKNELNLMYTNLWVYGIGNFTITTNIRYCSSSESGSSTVWALAFSNGVWNSGQSKGSSSLPVRAIRAF